MIMLKSEKSKDGHFGDIKIRLREMKSTYWITKKEKIILCANVRIGGKNRAEVPTITCKLIAQRRMVENEPLQHRLMENRAQILMTVWNQREQQSSCSEIAFSLMP
jgi:hypothetical protein